MIAALILVVAVVAVAQFGLIWWRATVAGVAAKPLSSKVLAAASVHTNDVSGEDFRTLATLLEACPAMKSEPDGLGSVGTYFHLLSAMNKVFGVAIPFVGDWARREMTTCARYAAVRVDQRMSRTQAICAQMRSY